MAQDGADHGLLFALQHGHPLADFVGGPALLQDAGHPITQAAVLFPADGLGAGALVISVHVMPPTLPVRGSRAALAATPGYLAPPIPATSPTGRAPAASLSSCAYLHGPAPGTDRRRA